jgi:CheY-like chemotaxis protein
VRLHGGEVRAQSDGIGRGSTFTITLPVLAAAAPGQPEDASPSMAAGASGLSVLVADDNSDAAETLTILLGLMGHRASCVPDGAAAIAAFQASQPDVVLLDIGMPGMDGYEVARRLRKLQRPDRRPPRLLALTGWGAANDRARAQEAGFDQHLTKPVDIAALQQALQADAMEVSGGWE